MKKGKVQTTTNNTNVLVEHENGSNKHYSPLDFEVKCEKLTDEEIDLEFSKIEFSRKDKINFLSKIKGFAISEVHCAEDRKYFTYGDLFRYIKK